MSNGWDDVKKGSGAGDFTEIKEGAPQVVHLLGDDPKRIATHWTAKKSMEAPKECQGATCMMCENPGEWKAAKITFSIPVYNLTKSKQEILQRGYSIFKIMRETRDAYGGDLSNVDFRLSAEGSGIDTKYSVIPIIPTKFKSEMVVDESPVDEEAHL